MTTQASVADDYTCEPCNVRCSTERAYKNHLRSNRHQETVGLPLHQHPCPGCQKLYSRRSEVKRHLEDGKCSGSRPRLNTESSNGTKHGLSVSPVGGVWKSQRTKGPTGERLSGVRDLRQDSAHAGIEADDPDHQNSYDLKTGVMTSTATLETERACFESCFPLEEAIPSSAHYHVHSFVKAPQHEPIQQSPKSLISLNLERHAVPREQQGIALASATQTAVARATAETGNALNLIALAESLDTMSFEEFKRWKMGSGQRMSGLCAIVQRASPRSLNTLSFDPSLANPDSLGGLFGLQGANTRTSAHVDMVVRSRPQKRLTRTFVGKYLCIDENREQELVEHAAEGHHREVHNLLVNNHVDMNYSDESFGCVQSAITVAVVNGHLAVLGAIFDVLRSTMFLGGLRLELDRIVWPRSYEEGLDRGGYLEALNHISREAVGTMCCLCPQEVRVGTVCEKVTLRQSFDKKETKSECRWGDKLLQPSWPSLSGLIEVATLEQEREFLLSVGLPLYLVRPNEKERLRAHEERLSSS